MPKFFIKTYGCQMNERDSEAVAAQLVAKGYSLAASEHVADVVLIENVVEGEGDSTGVAKDAIHAFAGQTFGQHARAAHDL